MKAIVKYIMPAVMAITALYSCNKSEQLVVNEEQEGPFTYTFTLGEADTRSTIGLEDGRKVINWEKGDQLGVYAVGADQTSYNRYANIDLDKTPNEFQISSYMALVEGDMIYAYAPYVDFSNKGLDNDNWKSPATVPMSIPAMQTQTGTTFDADAMPKVSIPYPMPAALDAQTNKPVGDIKMLNLGAIVNFKVYSSNIDYATEKVISVSFEAGSALAGDFVYDLTGVNYSDASTLAISGYSETEVVTRVKNAGTLGATKDAAFEVYMVVAPGTYTGNVVIKTDKARYTYPVNSKSFKRNVILNLGVNLGNCQNRVEETTVLPTTVSKTISEILTEMGKSEIESGTVVNPLIVDNVVTLKTTGTGNNAKIYGSAPSQDWRIYANGNGNVIVSVAEGYSLSSVKFTYSKESNPVFSGPASDVAESASGTAKTYTVTSSGHIRITAIEVEYVAESAKTPVSAPTGVEAIADEDAILVAWTDATDTHIDHYLVTCTGQTAQEIAPGVESALFEGLGNGTYVVTVTAIPGDTNNYTASTTWTNEAAPIVISGAGPDADTYEIVFSEKGYSNAAAVTTVPSTGPFTIVFDGGTNTTNDPKYYDSGAAVRMYDGNNLTVSSSMDIVGIEFEFDTNNNLNTTTGTYTGTTWSGKAKSIEFTSKGGQSRIKKMVISYINDGSYTPTVTGILVEDYTESFTESTSSTYSFDGKVYALYSDNSKVELSVNDYTVTGIVDMSTPNAYTVTISAVIGGIEYHEDIIINIQEEQQGGRESYTIVWNTTNNSKGVSSYTSSWTVTSDDLTCDMTNWNNNNNGWNYVKAGSRNSAITATIVTSTAIPEAIKTITLTIGATNASNVTGIKVYVSDSKTFDSTADGTFTNATGEQSVTLTPAANKYYKIEVTCAKSSNGVFQLNQLVFSTK